VHAPHGSRGGASARRDVPGLGLSELRLGGYFRFALAPADLLNLRKKGFSALSAYERVAYGNSLRAAFNRGVLPMKDATEAAALLANDSHQSVAGEPMGFVDEARDWLYGDPIALPWRATDDASSTRREKLGWQPGKGEDTDRTLLRPSVLSFLAFTARDPVVRAERRSAVSHSSATRRTARFTATRSTRTSPAWRSASWGKRPTRLCGTPFAPSSPRRKTRAPLAPHRRARVGQEPRARAAVRQLTVDPLLRATETLAPLGARCGVKRAARRRGAG